jgi:hypothetical protein
MICATYYSLAFKQVRLRVAQIQHHIDATSVKDNLFLHVHLGQF